VQIFRTFGEGVFVRRVPENDMFPYEGEVDLNTVLSTNALAREEDGPNPGPYTMLRLIASLENKELDHLVTWKRPVRKEKELPDNSSMINHINAFEKLSRTFGLCLMQDKLL
jgi:hypothetical protein